MANSGNDLIWICAWDVDTSEYIPQRQLRRISRCDNSFQNRTDCQIACDDRNTRKDKYRPLIITGPDEPKKN